MGILSKIFGGGRKQQVLEALASGGRIIDVRTPAEFNQGHADGAVNVPLDQLDRKISKLKQINKPLVLCCASGMRSGQAVSILKRKGFTDVYNAGSWRSLR